MIQAFTLLLWSDITSLRFPVETYESSFKPDFKWEVVLRPLYSIFLLKQVKVREMDYTPFIVFLILIFILFEKQFYDKLEKYDSKIIRK
jgi:hypothetical protein